MSAILPRPSCKAARRRVPPFWDSICGGVARKGVSRGGNLGGEGRLPFTRPARVGSGGAETRGSPWVPLHALAVVSTSQKGGEAHRFPGACSAPLRGLNRLAVVRSVGGADLGRAKKRNRGSFEHRHFQRRAARMQGDAAFGRALFSSARVAAYAAVTGVRGWRPPGGGVGAASPHGGAKKGAVAPRITAWWVWCARA